MTERLTPQQAVERAREVLANVTLPMERTGYLKVADPSGIVGYMESADLAEAVALAVSLLPQALDVVEAARRVAEPYLTDRDGDAIVDEDEMKALREALAAFAAKVQEVQG